MQTQPALAPAVAVVDGAQRSLWPAALFAAVMSAAGGLVTGWGLSESKPLWTIAGAVIFAVVAVSAAHKVAARVESRRAGGLATFCALGLIYMLVILAIGPTIGANDHPRRALRLAADDSAALVYLRSEPDGRELTGKHAPEPLRGKQVYDFGCVTEGSDHDAWAQTSEGGYWVPLSALVTEVGASPKLPSC